MMASREDGGGGGAGFLMVAEKSTVCAVCGDDGDGVHDHVGCG